MILNGPVRFQLFFKGDRADNLRCMSTRIPINESSQHECLVSNTGSLARIQ